MRPGVHTYPGLPACRRDNCCTGSSDCILGTCQQEGCSTIFNCQSGCLHKSKDIVKYGRIAYTSRVGWRGEILAVEDAVDAEMARICVLARIGHNLESIAVNEGELVGEEPIAAFSSTAGTSGAGNDSLLALRYRYQHDVSTANLDRNPRGTNSHTW